MPFVPTLYVPSYDVEYAIGGMLSLIQPRSINKCEALVQDCSHCKIPSLSCSLELLRGLKEEGVEQLACEIDIPCFSNSPALPRVQSVTLSAIPWQHKKSAHCCLCLPGDHLVWLYGAVHWKGAMVAVSFLPGDSELCGVYKTQLCILAPWVVFLRLLETIKLLLMHV